jgi:hypothetical protein
MLQPVNSGSGGPVATGSPSSATGSAVAGATKAETAMDGVGGASLALVLGSSQ